jgi:hypothetical protein
MIEIALAIVLAWILISTIQWWLPFVVWLAGILLAVGLVLATFVFLGTLW